LKSSGIPFLKIFNSGGAPLGKRALIFGGISPGTASSKYSSGGGPLGKSFFQASGRPFGQYFFNISGTDPLFLYLILIINYNF